VGTSRRGVYLGVHVVGLWWSSCSSEGRDRRLELVNRISDQNAEVSEFFLQPATINTGQERSTPLCTLHQNTPDEAVQLLGIQIAMDGNYTKELGVYMQRNHQYVQALQECNLSQLEAGIMHKQCYLLTVFYPLPATNIPPDLLHTPSQSNYCFLGKNGILTNHAESSGRHPQITRWPWFLTPWLWARGTTNPPTAQTPPGMHNKWGTIQPGDQHLPTTLHFFQPNSRGYKALSMDHHRMDELPTTIFAHYKTVKLSLTDCGHYPTIAKAVNI